MYALEATFFIVVALAAGYLSSALVMPAWLVSRLTKLLSPLVWVLLFLIGAEFGDAISSLQAVAYVLKNSLLIALVTTAIPCLLLWGLRVLESKSAGTPSSRVTRESFDWRATAAPLKECAIALSMVVLGVCFHVACTRMPAIGRLWLPSSHVMLMALIFLVGLDLSGMKIGRSWIAWRVLSVPVAVVIGSILGAYAIHLIIGQDIRLLLALSTGFGWFTLSSVLVGSLSSEIHGATALVTDLSRELLAIILLYLIGGRDPRAGIAAAGATALDSTLPIVRQTCHADMLPIALMSGFILTILAPFLITFFLTF